MGTEALRLSTQALLLLADDLNAYVQVFVSIAAYFNVWVLHCMHVAACRQTLVKKV